MRSAYQILLWKNCEDRCCGADHVWRGESGVAIQNPSEWDLFDFLLWEHGIVLLAFHMLSTGWIRN